MRIWVINPFDELPNEPGRPGRFWSLCQVLAAHGHEVVWWTADFSHRRKVARMWSVDDQCRVKFTIRLVPVKPYQANVGWARLRSHVAFGRNLELALRAETAAGRRPDRIVASWPPVEGGEVAVRLGREWGVPVTIDVMDAWPAAFARFIPGPAWLAQLALAPWRRRARKVFAASERVSGVGRAFLNYARELGARGPVHLTYLGAWFEEGRAASSLTTSSANTDTYLARTEVRALPGAPLRLLYLGNIGRSQDIATVVAGLALVRARGHDVRLDVAGSGECEAELVRSVKEAGLGEVVRLHGFLTGAELDALVAGAHLGVNPVRGESFIACPYKVADYLAAGLPVINSLLGELAELLREYGAGRQFAAGNAESFAVALEAWVKAPETLASMSAGARRLGEEWFARERTYPELARFVSGEGRGAEDRGRKTE